MEQLPGGYTLSLCPDSFPLSTDSMALAHFVRLPKGAAVLDLGSGCGTLGLLLCGRDPLCQVTGLEISEQPHLEALTNIRRNHLDSRLQSICTDLRLVSGLFDPGGFSVCVSNPPYFSGGPSSLRTPTARREDLCTPEDLFSAAAWCLKYGGSFFLVHKPERLAQLIAVAAGHHLEAKRLCLLRHAPGSPVNLVLLQFRKGGKPGLLWEEWCLYAQDGTPSDIYHEIYHQ